MENNAQERVSLGGGKSEHIFWAPMKFRTHLGAMPKARADRSVDPIEEAQVIDSTFGKTHKAH